MSEGESVSQGGLYWHCSAACHRTGSIAATARLRLSHLTTKQHKPHANTQSQKLGLIDAASIHDWPARVAGWSQKKATIHKLSFTFPWPKLSSSNIKIMWWPVLFKIFKWTRTDRILRIIFTKCFLQLSVVTQGQWLKYYLSMTDYLWPHTSVGDSELWLRHDAATRSQSCDWIRMPPQWNDTSGARGAMSIETPHSSPQPSPRPAQSRVTTR